MVDPQPTDADALIEQLLYQPPQSDEQLRARTESVAPEDLRDGLLERIEAGELDDIDAVVAGNVFDAVGLGDARERLVDLVASPLPDASDEHRRTRKAAFIVLAMHDDFEPEDPDTVFGIDADQYADLAASVYASLFEFTRMNLELVYEFGDMLLQEPSDVRPRMFDQLESYRSETDVDAGLLYRPLLEEETYRELWPLLVEAVVDEGVPRDADWLERAAARVDDDGAAQRFRKAAMELRTHGVETDVPEGFALVGTPDGAGAFPLFVFTDRDEGVFDGHNLVFRHHSASVHDGFYVPNMVREEVDDLVEDIEETRATVLTEIPVALGIRLAHWYLDDTDQDPSQLPPETRLSVYRLQRMSDGGVDLPEPLPADSLDREFVRERFEHDACFESWFFDRTTLESAAVLPVPERDEDKKAWKKEAGQNLADSGDVSRRIVENLRFVALWYLLDGDERAARQFAALADAADESFASSLAMDLLLDHTVDAVREMQDYAGAFLVEVLGDDSLRANLHDYHLEGRGFAEDREERYLNFMELTYRTLEELQSEFPPEVQPSVDQMMEAAGPVGLVMANFFDSEPTGPPDDLADTAADELRAAGMSEEVIGVYVSELLTNGRLLAMVRD